MLHHAPRLFTQAGPAPHERHELEQPNTDCASCDRDQPGFRVRRLARLLAHHREYVEHDFRQVRGQRHVRTAHLHSAEEEQGQQQTVAEGAVS